MPGPLRRRFIPAGGRPSVGERQLGVVGELAPEIAARYDLQGRVAVFIVDLAPVLDAKRRS